MRGKNEIGKLFIARDITARKEMERELKHYKNHLEELVRKREEALKQSNHQLFQAQKMEMVGNLAGGLAHDFNNILGGINGSTRLIRDALEEIELTERFRTDIEIIERGIKRAKDMVTRLLSLSRRRESAKEPVDLQEAVSQVVEICRKTFDKSILVEWKPSPRSSLVLGDSQQIEQVILNIAINSFHAMTLMRNSTDDMGGVLEILLKKVKAPEIGSGLYWMLSLRDTGVGMEPEVIEKIFDPFFTHGKGDGGSGLGLSMVYTIVTSMNGSIRVESRPREGSVFKIYLPVLRERRRTAEHSVERKSAVFGSGRVLIVDDDDLVLESGRRMLASRGIRRCCSHIRDRSCRHIQQGGSRFQSGGSGHGHARNERERGVFCNERDRAGSESCAGVRLHIRSKGQRST